MVKLSAVRQYHTVSYFESFVKNEGHMVARFMTEWTQLVVNSNGWFINDRTIYSEKFDNFQLGPVTERNVRALTKATFRASKIVQF